jgi:hypothetical protein
MAGALRVLGTNAYGFFFRYMLAPSLCLKDRRVDAVRLLHSMLT